MNPGWAQPAAADWTATAGLDGPRTSLAATVIGNRLYVLGGLTSGGDGFRLHGDVQAATLGNDGTINAGAWQHAGALPTARSGPGAIAHAGRTYVVGGFSERGTLVDVNVATLAGEGDVAMWEESANQLATPRSNQALQLRTTAASTTYLAAIAGVGDVGADTVHFDDVEASVLQAFSATRSGETTPTTPTYTSEDLQRCRLGNRSGRHGDRPHATLTGGATRLSKTAQWSFGIGHSAAGAGSSLATGGSG